MATTAFPLDALSGAPSYYAQSIRQAFSAFLGTAPAGRPLGAVSGVRPGTPSTTVTVSGFTWACAAHSGVLDVQASAMAGPYLYATDGNDTSSIQAANATNPRVDIVFVQVNDTVQDGSGAESASVGYLAGTPASTPSPPAAPARSMVLAQISVPKSGGGNPTVSWVAPTYGASAWGSYTPSLSNWTVGNGTLTGAWQRIGNTIFYRIRFTAGSTSTFSGAFQVSLPVDANSGPSSSALPLGQAGLFDNSASARAFRTARYAGSGTIALYDQGGTQVNSTVPWTWAAGDMVEINGSYESA